MADKREDKTMKQTEIGMIPDDWEVKNIFKNCTIKARIGWQGLKSTEYLKIGDYLLITGTDFCNGFINWKSCSYVTEWRFKQDRNIQIQDGDVLITKDGTIGKVAFIPRVPLSGTLNSGVFVVRPKDKSVIDVVFLSLVFKSFWFVNFLEQITSGSTIVHLYQKDFVKFNFPLPPTLAEQQKIAKALSDVDNVISTLEKLITKKKNLKQGTMQQLLTGKKRLPGFSKTDKFKQTEIGEIPEDWEVVNIQEVLVSSKDKLKIGPFGSQLKKEYLLETGLYKVFGQENIYSNNFDYCYRFLTREHFQNLQSCELKEGDFVISTMGTIGKCAVVPENAGIGIMDSHLVRLRLNQNIDKDYFKYYFQSNIIQNQIKALSVGGIMDGLSTSIIKKLDVIKFSKSEQTAIANVLSSMDKEIEALEAKLGKYRNLKTGMMQQLLTGKIRLG